LPSETAPPTPDLKGEIDPYLSTCFWAHDSHALRKHAAVLTGGCLASTAARNAHRIARAACGLPTGEASHA